MAKVGEVDLYLNDVIALNKSLKASLYENQLNKPKINEVRN